MVPANMKIEFGDETVVLPSHNSQAKTVSGVLIYLDQVSAGRFQIVARVPTLKITQYKNIKPKMISCDWV